MRLTLPERARLATCFNDVPCVASRNPFDMVAESSWFLPSSYRTDSKAITRRDVGRGVMSFQ